MSLLNNPFDPAREAALVTGAGNGIGRAIAQALVGEGVRTVFADVNQETLTAAIKASPRPELAVPWIGDLSSRAACDELLAHAQSALKQVTHFVHSASPARREADHAFAVNSETWEQMRAVNVDAGFHLARELARKLVAAHAPGSFLLLTSLHAAQPAALLDLQSGSGHAGQGIGEDLGPPWNPGERAGARRHRGGRLRRRSIAGETHPARPPWPQRRPRADGVGGAFEPGVGLRHRRCDRGRRRPIADELV